jgi:hypothetical protein
MDSGWFYIDRGSRHGPITLDALKAALVATPDPRRVLVWHEGMPDWGEAGLVGELARVLPPPSPPPPPLPSPVVLAVPEPEENVDPCPPRAQPVAWSPGSSFLGGQTPLHAIELAAGHYRALVLIVGAQILLGLSIVFAGALPRDVAPIVSGLLSFVGLGLGIATLVVVYRLADEIDAGPPSLCLLLTIVPCVGLNALLVLSAKAQSWCKRQGIEVGLFGPTPASIERLRAERAEE